MSRNNRKTAELLDAALDRMLEGQAAYADSLQKLPVSSAELQPLLETAGRLRRTFAPDAPSPELVKKTERRLLHELKQLNSKPARPATLSATFSRRGWLRTAAVSLAAVAVLFLTGWGANLASAQALPGDALYPVKRGIEEVSLAFSWSAAGDVKLLAAFADRRLEEVQELVRRNRDADVASALQEYTEALLRLDSAMEKLPHAASGDQLDAIQEQLAKHTETLKNLQPQLPDEAQEAVNRALGESQKSEEIVNQLNQNGGSQASPTLPASTATEEPRQVEETPAPSAMETKSLEPVEDTVKATGETPSPTPKTEDGVVEEKPDKTPKPIITPRPTNTHKPEVTVKPVNTEDISPGEISSAGKIVAP